MAVIVRDAQLHDLAAIVEFNARLALETEHKTLDREVLTRGVSRALAEPGRLRYWVAADSEAAQVVGQVGSTREWSDWRDGWVWWLQSVYVEASSRGQGVFRALHGHVRNLARSDPNVIGLRLYVETSNHRAQDAYRALGLATGGYDVYEEIWMPS